MQITRREQVGVFKFVLNLSLVLNGDRPIRKEMDPKINKAFAELGDKVCEIFTEHEEEPVSS